MSPELKKILFGSYGFFGPQDLYILDLVAMKIFKESRESQWSESPVTKTSKSIAPMDRAKIKKVLELLQINNLEDYYSNPDILDGEQWSFEAHFSDGTIIESGGSNAYPKHFEKFRRIFKPLD